MGGKKGQWLKMGWYICVVVQVKDAATLVDIYAWLSRSRMLLHWLVYMRGCPGQGCCCIGWYVCVVVQVKDAATLVGIYAWLSRSRMLLHWLIYMRGCPGQGCCYIG